MRLALATFWNSFHGEIGEVLYGLVVMAAALDAWVYSVRPWERL